MLSTITIFIAGKKYKLKENKKSLINIWHKKFEN